MEKKKVVFNNDKRRFQMCVNTSDEQKLVESNFWKIVFVVHNKLTALCKVYNDDQNNMQFTIPSNFSVCEQLFQ